MRPFVGIATFDRSVVGKSSIAFLEFINCGRNDLSCLQLFGDGNITQSLLCQREYQSDALSGYRINGKVSGAILLLA